MSSVTFKSICPPHCRMVFIETRTTGKNPYKDPVIQIALGALDVNMTSFSNIRWFNVNETGTLVYDSSSVNSPLKYKSKKIEEYVTETGGPSALELVADSVSLWDACIRYHQFLSESPVGLPGILFASRRPDFDSGVLRQMTQKCGFPDQHDIYWIDLGLIWNAPIRIKPNAPAIPRTPVDAHTGFNVQAVDALHKCMDLSHAVGVAR